MKKKNYCIIFILCFLITFHVQAQEIYISTAANSKYYQHLLQLIGSIHKHHVDLQGQIAVFDLGLSDREKIYLNSIKNVCVYDIEHVHKDILKPFEVYGGGYSKTVPGWYAWKFVILKQSLDMFPSVLYLDAGTTVLKPLNEFVSVLDQQGYFLCTIGDDYKEGKPIHPLRWGTTTRIKQLFDLDNPCNTWLLDQEFVMGGIVGFTRTMYQFVYQLYSLSKHIELFQDDGTAPGGFGCARHDQPILTCMAYKNKLIIHKQDPAQYMPMQLKLPTDQLLNAYITWDEKYVDHRTMLYSSRNDLRHYAAYVKEIRFK